VARITPCLENGKTALVDFLEPDQTAWGSTEFLVLHANAPASVEFAYCLGRSAAFRDYAVGSMNGSSGRQRAPAVAIARFPTVCPPAKLLECFAQVVGSFVRLMAANDRGRELLSALRSVLLPELISGDRDLDAAQSALSAPGRL
jgi:type I restriction enzyme S subunit